MSDFSFRLSEKEKQYLKDLVASSIKGKFSGDDEIPAEPDDHKLTKELGAFVTLKIGGSLRGCIGNVQGSGPLYKTIWNMARAAAFQDPRFPPVTEDEAEVLEIEISVLSPVNYCRSPEQIVVGRHGLIVQRGQNVGLLLPQVAEEQGWDKYEFLSNTCRKAGLPEDCWNKVGTDIFWFEAEIF
ncbi:AmmeMemoRadiSam system protein A [Salidesulfovibrio brasiliensis]|uniref:AmmeMemoRadiSam system protein A n=1 Tax=Salidesulfovibrio brasiliensis TaxID=221711 RepID=UPI0006D01C03|nr:AmmeMemoRadiSam system protein A [Salidesulfovibrio brasiliensis]